MDGPVVLVVAPDTPLPFKGFSTKDFLGRMPNIGVRYLAAVIEARGARAVVLDRQHAGISPLRLASEINALRPSLVGFTLYDVTMPSTHATISLLRHAYKGPIVVGGYTPTFHADDILRAWPEVDYIIVREGETAVVALQEHLRGQRPIEQVPNLVYRTRLGIRHNPESPLADVTTLPWPQRAWPEEGDVTPIVTRRGCLSRCSFCSMVPFYDVSLGPIVRWRTPSDVANEIAACIDRGSRDFMFYDDDFGRSSGPEREWSERFLTEVRTRRLDFNWGVELRVADVVRGSGLLRELCDIGLTHISLGMESMLPRQLKLYNKGYRQEDVFRAVEIARTLPIDHQTNVIFWDPWVTLDEAVEHLDLLDRIGIHEQLGSANFPFFAGILVARRGTKIHDLLSGAQALRLRPGTVCEYEYDFVDADVAAFHRGPYRTFMLRVRKTARPPALWLFVPRLERDGEHARARAYRAYAGAVSRIEFDYFRALLLAVHNEPDRARWDTAADEVHRTYGPEIDACASLLQGADKGVAATA